VADCHIRRHSETRQAPQAPVCRSRTVGPALAGRPARPLPGSAFRRIIVASSIIITTTTTTGKPFAVIQWNAAIAALDKGQPPCSPSEQAILRIAASLADPHFAVRLGQNLGTIDSRNITLVTDAHDCRAAAPARKMPDDPDSAVALRLHRHTVHCGLSLSRPVRLRRAQESRRPLAVPGGQRRPRRCQRHRPSRNTLIYVPNPQIAFCGIHGGVANALGQAPRFTTPA
jgi:hypothetical protein